MEIKAANIYALKKLFQSQNPAAEDAFKRSLSSPARQSYDAAVASSWLPFEHENEIMQTAARLLFPNDPKPLLNLMRLVFQDLFTGIFKTFLKAPSIDAIIRYIPNFWQLYFKVGHARLEHFGQHQGVMLVTDAPALLPHHLEQIAASMVAVMEMIGLRQVAIDIDLKDSHAWRFLVRWLPA